MTARAKANGNDDGLVSRRSPTETLGDDIYRNGKGKGIISGAEI